MNPTQSNSDTVVSHDQKSCRAARIVGVVGILLSLFPIGYAFAAIPKEGMAIIPLIIFWTGMVIGVLVGSIRRGRTGIGGKFVLLMGLHYIIFLIIRLFVGDWKTGGEAVALIAILPLFVSGILFLQCGRR